MQSCLELAQIPDNCLLPNPRVGALIVHQSKIIAKGFHRGPGTPHAEIAAIRDAEEKGFRKFSQADLYVNLEPCCHLNKRTPPCTPQLIEKAFKNIFIAQLDPHPLVRGKGRDQLRKSGIKVSVGLLNEAAQDLNQAFIKNQTRKETYIAMKLALSFDGKMATDSGQSQWITSESSRLFVHQLRNQATAIGLGRRSIEVDNPRLSIRINRKPEKLSKLVIFGRPKALKSKKIWKLFGPDRIIVWDKKIERLPRDLYQDYGIYQLLVEGGPKLASSLLLKALVDELHLFYGRGFIGGKGRFGLGRDWTLKSLTDSVSFQPQSAGLIGPDLYANGRLNVYRYHPKNR